jgi:hypothetical protein
MALTVSDHGGGEFFLIPEGTHLATCYGIVDVGTQETAYGDKQQMLVLWELPQVRHVFKEERGEEPAVISKWFTASLNEKSNLRAALVAWRGKGFTEKELQGFEMKRVLGAGCMLAITHKANQKGDPRPRISSVMALPQGTQVPAASLESFYYQIEELTGGDYEKLPQWIKKALGNSAEFKKAGIEVVDMQPAETGDGPPNDTVETDDIPF